MCSPSDIVDLGNYTGQAGPFSIAFTAVAASGLPKLLGNHFHPAQSASKFRKSMETIFWKNNTEVKDSIFGPAKKTAKKSYFIVNG